MKEKLVGSTTYRIMQSCSHKDRQVNHHYDASAKSDGVALNDCLYSGPPLAENIFDVLLRFRVNQVALTGDVEKAFRMVGITVEDRGALRFLWVDDIDKFSPEIEVHSRCIWSLMQSFPAKCHNQASY